MRTNRVPKSIPIGLIWLRTQEKRLNVLPLCLHKIFLVSLNARTVLTTDKEARRFAFSNP